MFNGIKEYLFLVVDNDTNGILTNCVSASVANAVSSGLVNASTMIIKFSFIRNNHPVTRYQEDVRLNYKLVKLYDMSKLDNKPAGWGGESNNFQYYQSSESNKPFDLIDLDKEIITADWIKKRKIANLRSKYIRNLESTCERYLGRLKKFVSDEVFFQYLSSQLPLVNIEKNQYPNSIIEYAEIANLTPFSAYQELKMIYDSTGISHMRIHAVWNKYVDEINTFETEEDVQNIYQRIETELIHGER